MNPIYKVLVVDDIEENLQVVGSILSKENIPISLAKSGRHALKILAKKTLDLVLLDISMPEMDGYEVCRIMKQDDRLKEIPVIFLTAQTEIEDIIRAFEVGAVDYLTKPFNKHELLSRVFTHLNLKKARDIVVEQQKELEIKNAELEAQKNKIEKQRDNIISSIRYAEIIQQAVLPCKDILDGFLPENFIINLPKDIVSGDFYWFKQIGHCIAIAAADCTGHGVPGAFMSMLGISSLNEIFANFESIAKVNAAEILNVLRNKIKNALHQNIKEPSSRDGIDMALCIIDLDNKKMQYAGANSPMYLIRKNANSMPELTEYKPDKMPVSIHVHERAFTNHLLDLQPDDKIYIFTDGYSDQFGGKNDKKFMAKRLKDLLVDNYQKSMPEQKNILLSSLQNWQGNFEQVDDILLIGMKIS